MYGAHLKTNTTVDPCGKGIHDTTDRSELCGILAALEHRIHIEENAVILADSQTSSCAIRTYLLRTASVS